MTSGLTDSPSSPRKSPPCSGWASFTRCSLRLRNQPGRLPWLGPDLEPQSSDHSPTARLQAHGCTAKDLSSFP
nr:MAG TPA: hypothetical protein [Caudoviricetes sp.]